MSSRGSPEPLRLAGLSHVATISFVAARIAPPIGFGVSLAGGLALARAGQRAGLRQGYGAGLGTILETVAIAGPTRLGGAISQAITAPLLGRMEGDGVASAWQVGACVLLRFAYNAITTALFIWVLAGGLPAYAGTYDSAFGSLRLLPSGPLAALIATAIALLAWAGFAIVDSVLAWVGHESLGFRTVETPAAYRLAFGWRDAALVTVAAATAPALLLG